MQFKFYRDKNGYPRAEVASPFEVLGIYLEEDIQSSAAYCHDLIQTIDSISSEMQNTWESTGNAHTLTLTATSARILNEYSDSVPPCEISLEEFKAVLEEWQSFIRRKS